MRGVPCGCPNEGRCGHSIEPSCIFCKIIQGHAPATVLRRTVDHMVIEPLGPHVPGHVLVLPRRHLPTALTEPDLTGRAFMAAAEWAATHVTTPGVQLLTSAGEAATQTVMHLHVHVLPRGPEDGLPADWPWMRADR